MLTEKKQCALINVEIRRTERRIKVMAEEIVKRPAELIETVDLMLSSDYENRFKGEYYQLIIRIKKLDKFIRQFKQGELENKPNTSIDVLERQLQNMLSYSKTMEVRAEIEGIEL